MSQDPLEIEYARLQELAKQATDLLHALPDRLIIGGAGVLLGAAVGTLLKNDHTLQQVHDIVDSLAALHAQGVGADAVPGEPN